MYRFIKKEHLNKVVEDLARKKLEQFEQTNKELQTLRGLCSTAINVARANPYTTAAIVGVTLILFAFMAYYYQVQQKRIQELEQKAQNISTRSLPVYLPLNNNEVDVQTEGLNSYNEEEMPTGVSNSYNEESINLNDNYESDNQEAVKKYIDQVFNEATNKVVLYSVQKELDNSEDKNKELEKKVAELQAELTASEERNKLSKQELEGCKKENQDNNIVIKTLRKENSDFKEELKNEKAFYKQSINLLELANNQLLSDASNYEAEIQGLKETNDAIKTELQKEKEEGRLLIERLLMQNEDLETQIQQKEELANQQTNKLTELQNTVTEFNQKTEELQNELIQKETEVNEERQHLQTQVQQLTEELNTSNEELIKSNEENVQLANEKTDIEQKFAEERKSFEDNISNLQVLNNRLVQTLNENKKELESKIQENGKLTEELQSAKSASEVAIQQLEDQLTQQQGVVEELNAANQEIQNELIQKDTEMNGLKEAIQQLELKIQENGKLTEELQNELAQKETALKKVEQELELKLQENGKLTEELQSAKSASEVAIQQLEDQLTQQQGVVEELNAANQEIQNELIQKDTEMNGLKEAIQQLELKLQENGKLTQKLQSELTQKEAELNAVKEEKQQLQAKIEELTEELQSAKSDSEKARQELQTQVQEKEELVEQFQVQIAQKETEVDKLNEANQRLEDQLTQQQGVVEELNAANQEIQNELIQKDTEMNGLKEAIQQLELKLQENGNLTQHLRTQAQANEEKTRQLEERILMGYEEIITLNKSAVEKNDFFKKEKDRLMKEMEAKAEEIEKLNNKLNNPTDSEPWSPNDTSRSVLEALGNDDGSEPPAVGEQKKNYTKQKHYSPYSHNVVDTRWIKSEGRKFRKNTDQSESETVAYNTLSTVELGIKPLARVIVRNNFDFLSQNRLIKALKKKNHELNTENNRLNSILNNTDVNSKFTTQLNLLKSGSGSDSGDETFSDDESVESKESNAENNTMNVVEKIVEQNINDASNTEATQNFVDCNNSHKQVKENMKTPTRDSNGTTVGAPTKLSNNLENEASNPQCERMKDLEPSRKISKRLTKIGAVTPRKSKDGSNAELSVMQQNFQEIKKVYEDTAESITKNIANYKKTLKSKESTDCDKNRAVIYLKHLNVLKGIAPFFEITAQTEDKYLYMIDFCIGAYKGTLKELDYMVAPVNTQERYVLKRVLVHLKITMDTYLKADSLASTTFTKGMLKEMIKGVEVKIKACESKGKNTNGPDLKGFCNTLVDGLQTSAGVTGDNKGDITRLVTENNLSDCGNNKLNNNSALVNNEFTNNLKVPNNLSINHGELGKTGSNANGNNIKTVADVLKANQDLNKVKKNTNPNKRTDSNENSHVQRLQNNTDNNQKKNNPSPLFERNNNIGATTNIISNGKSTYATVVGAGGVGGRGGIWK